MKIELIGQGSYGCVFKPNIPCTNAKPTDAKEKKSKKQYLSKLQRNLPNSEREEALGKLIKNIKNYNKMFAPIIDSCPINIEKVDKTAIDKCTVITNGLDQGFNVEYKSYRMRNAGDKYLSKYLLSLVSKHPHKLMKRMLETHIYLLKSLDKLVKLNLPIIHYDLKDNNIIYDEKLGVPIIIDFGLSFELDIKKPFNQAIALEQYYIFYEKYPPWCIELVLLSYIVDQIADIKSSIKDSDISKLKEICNTFVSENDIFIDNGITREEAEIFKQGLYTFISAYLGKTWNILFQDLQKGYASWDNYSLSIIYLFYIQDFLNKIESPLINKYIEIIKKNILGIPNGKDELFRYSISDTLSELKKISVKTNKMEYNKLIQSIQNNSIDPNMLNFLNIKINKHILTNTIEDKAK